MTTKNSKYVKITTVNALYLIINKVNEYSEEIHKNNCNYLTLASTHESKKQYSNCGVEPEI